MAGMAGMKAAKPAICTLICCLICCIIPGVVALVILNGTLVDWPVADGTVVSTRRCSDGRMTKTDKPRNPSYLVMYNYTTSQGQDFTSETVSCGSNNPKEGEIISIIYDPEDPKMIVEKVNLDTGLVASKSAIGIGFGVGVIALCKAIFMCTRPDPPPNNNAQTTYQSNTYEANKNTHGNTDKYKTNNSFSSDPVSGPTGDIPAPAATTVLVQPMQADYSYTTPVSSGAVKFYK